METNIETTTGIDTEVLVIGGNPGGCAAAIAAARAGRRVVLVEPTPTLGGINTNGVFAFDSATPQALGGIAAEFSERIRAHYRSRDLDDPLFQRRSDQVWESHVAATVWGEMAAQTPGLTVHLGLVPIGVRMQGRRIHAVELAAAADPFGNVAHPPLASHLARAQIVIDASYEADVAAWAGVPFRIGREARSHEEPHAGMITTTGHPEGSAGWLPNTILPGSTGEADDAIMAFACRLHCRLYADKSPDAAHRLREPPPGYDSSRYAFPPVGKGPDGAPVFFNSIFVLVNGKYLLNRMVRGNNLAAPGRDYILAHPAERKALRERYVHHALGFLYFVQNEAGLPGLGLATDEFTDNSHIPYQIYVREGRRIEARQLLTEADVTPFITGDGLRAPPKPDAIAIGDWPVESHGCRDEVKPGRTQPEGWLFNRASRAPHQVPYGALLPPNVDNLLVSGAIGATHIAFSALRVESVRMQNGTAAGLAASLALARGCPPADVPIGLLQDAIVAAKGKLVYFADVDASHPAFADIQWAASRGLVPGDEKWRFFPEQPVDWAEFVRATVVVLGLPISVTGAHFAGIGPRHAAFRYAEALYDLGTRASIDLFNSRQLLAEEDPVPAILRHDTGPRLTPFDADGHVTQARAAGFLRLVRQAMGDAAPAMATEPGLLTRAQLCRLLRQMPVYRHAPSQQTTSGD